MVYDRREQIVTLLHRDGIVKVAELVKMFGVSIETIRRDLEDLERQGILKRVYGGAVAGKKRGLEPNIELRKTEHYEQKKAIGEKAAELVEDGDVIVIDLGTTTLELARALVGKKTSLTVLTNSIPIAVVLSQDSNIRVFLIGGEVRKGELSVSGNLADENIGMFQTDKVFLGVGGLTEKYGITDFHVEETPFRRISVSRTQKVLALADHSKFGITAMNVVCDVSGIDVLITDTGADPDAVQKFRNKGIEVICAGEAETKK